MIWQDENTVGDLVRLNDAGRKIRLDYMAHQEGTIEGTETFRIDNRAGETVEQALWVRVNWGPMEVGGPDQIYLERPEFLEQIT